MSTEFIDRCLFLCNADHECMADAARSELAELKAKAAFADACNAQPSFAAFWLEKYAEKLETEAVVRAHILHAAEHEPRD